MADTRISALPAITAAETADADLLPIVDQSAGANRKMTFGEAKAALSVDAQAAQAAAEAAQAAAELAETNAETARDAAFVNAAVYVDVATGLAAVADGVQFQVVSADGMSVERYRRDAGPVATLVATYPSGEAYYSKILDSSPVGYSFGISDADGNVALGIKDDGTVEVSELLAQDVVASTGTFVTSTATTHATANSEAADQTGHVGYAWVVEDANGDAAVAIRDDGAFVANDVVAETLNGLPVPSHIGRHGGRYSHQINFINNTGQSLAEGCSPATALTTVQEYDNIGFPARSTSPTAFLELTVALTQYSTRGESPMYGTLGHIKELIAEENGIAYADNDYQLLCCNNGYGGYTISQLNKGTAPYAAAISQVQAGYDIATAAGKTFVHQANTWTQGEADDLTSQSAYRDLFIQLAEDYNADSRAITGQWNDVITIAKQNTNENRHVALAQLEASEMTPLIAIACPMYQFDFYDYAHIDATNTKWLGGYYGLVYKRMVVDGLPWQPLKPVSHAVIGNVIDLYFNKEGLVLDTTLVPAQPDSGFTVKNGSGVEIAITSVAVIKPNRVRITCASAPDSGWTVYYGLKAAVDKGPYTGGCGNLRDSQGDSIIYSAVTKPLHNWCVLFDYTI